MRRRLKIERLKRHYSQLDMAGLLGLQCEHYYGEIELGKANPRTEFWEKAEKILGVPREKLMDNTGENDGTLKAARVRRARNDV